MYTAPRALFDGLTFDGASLEGADVVCEVCIIQEDLRATIEQKSAATISSCIVVKLHILNLSSLRVCEANTASLKRGHIPSDYEIAKCCIQRSVDLQST